MCQLILTISIADFWGIDKAIPDFNDNRGVSLVLINNEMGKWLFDQNTDCMICKKSEIKECLQPPLQAPFEEPKFRSEFWKDKLKYPFEFLVAKYTYHGIIQRLKRFLKRFFVLK